MKPKLYLMPVPIAESRSSDWIGTQYQNIIKETSLYFVENVRTARRFISSLKLGISIDGLQFEVLDKDSKPVDIQNFVKGIRANKSAIIMSESGCPGVADPGSLLVDEAHKLGIEIIPIVGPSSIVLALMGSGLSGQNFCFHGYLPIQKEERLKWIKSLEKESSQRKQTQIFIETPYRNQSVWNALTETLHSETRLAFATDLLGSNQKIEQKKVKNWRQNTEIQWDKNPTVFLFLAE